MISVVNAGSPHVVYQGTIIPELLTFVFPVSLRVLQHRLALHFLSRTLMVTFVVRFLFLLVATSIYTPATHNLQKIAACLCMDKSQMLSNFIFQHPSLHVWFLSNLFLQPFSLVQLSLCVACVLLCRPHVICAACMYPGYFECNLLSMEK